MSKFMKVKLRVVRSGLSAKSLEKSNWYVSKLSVVYVYNVHVVSGVSHG